MSNHRRRPGCITSTVFRETIRNPIDTRHGIKYVSPARTPGCIPSKSFSETFSSKGSPFSPTLPTFSLDDISLSRLTVGLSLRDFLIEREKELDPLGIILESSDIITSFFYGRMLDTLGIYLSQNEIAILKSLILGTEEILVDSNPPTFSKESQLNPLNVEFDSTSPSLIKSLALGTLEINLNLEDFEYRFGGNSIDLENQLGEIILDIIQLGLERLYSLTTLHMDLSVLGIDIQSALGLGVNGIEASIQGLTLEKALSLNTLEIELNLPNIGIDKILVTDQKEILTSITNINMEKNKGLDELGIFTSLEGVNKTKYLSLYPLTIDLDPGYPNYNVYFSTEVVEIYMSAIDISAALEGGGSEESSTLLDDLGFTASLAYSTRLLRTAYTGYCMQVRRTSDNATVDIGFDGAGNLDVAAIAAHCGANNGHVAVWYDQSGNSRNQIQTTVDRQPQIWDGDNEEVIMMTGTSKPALFFGGIIHSTRHRMLADFDRFAVPDNFSSIVVLERLAPGDYFMVGGGTYSNALPSWWTDNYIYWFPGFYGDADPTPTERLTGSVAVTSTGVFDLVSARTISGGQVWLDAESYGTYSGDFNNPEWNTSVIELNATFSPSQGYVSEIITLVSASSGFSASDIHNHTSTWWGY